MALISLIPVLSLKEEFMSGINNLNFGGVRKEEIRAKNARAFGWIKTPLPISAERPKGILKR